MYRRLFLSVILSGTLACIVFTACTKDKTPVPAASANPCDPNKVYFERSVRPIINSNCAMSGCHDATTKQDGVDLSSYEGIRREVRPGRPQDSELIEKINESDPDDRMPPPPRAPLSKEQKDILWKWVLQGADNATCEDDPNSCATTAVSFASDIRPILNGNCIGCHSGGTISGGVDLSSHAGVSAVAASGKLYNAVSQNGQATPMPPNGKLSACDISKIKAWVDAGHGNN